MENLLQLAVPLVVGIAIGYFLFKKLSGGTTHPPTVDPDDMAQPDGVISVDEAISLHKNYKNTRYSVINETIRSNTNDSDFIDTQFVWFSYEKMRKYMKYLRVIQKKNKGNKPISGIRVYFGAYGNGGKHPNQQTIFLTPTIECDISEEGNMKNLPFSIIPTNAENPLVGRYQIIRDLLIEEYHADKRFNAALMSMNSRASSENKNINLVHKSTENGGGNGTSASFNDGELSPPPSK